MPSYIHPSEITVRTVIVPDSYSTRDFEEHIRIENYWNQVRLSQEFSKAAVQSKSHASDENRIVIE